MTGRNLRIDADPLARLDLHPRDTVRRLVALVDGLSLAEQRHVGVIVATGRATLLRSEHPRSGAEAAASVQLFDLLSTLVTQAGAGLYREDAGAAFFDRTAGGR